MRLISLSVTLLSQLVSSQSASASYSAYPSNSTTAPFNVANETNFVTVTGSQDFYVTGPYLETVHQVFDDDRFPTGIAVDFSDRIYLNYPRNLAGLSSNHTVSVGRTTNMTGDEPFPNAEIQNCQPGQNASTCFVNVQSVVLDSSERLWALDTGIGAGNTAMIPTPFAAKIMAFNVTTGATLATYILPDSISQPSNGSLIGANLNDVRFNLSMSTAGVAFLTESQGGSLIVIDLGSGQITQRLKNTTATNADPKFVGIFDGTPTYMYNMTTGAKGYINFGADGIALANGMVYFSALSSRNLYAVPQDILADSSATDADILAAVTLVQQTGSFSDGLAADSAGHIYFTAAEQNAINVLNTTNTNDTVIPLDSQVIEPFVRSAQIQYADSAQVMNGYLYFTISQLPLFPTLHMGEDRRVRPYNVFRVYTGTTLPGLTNATSTGNLTSSAPASVPMASASSMLR